MNRVVVFDPGGLSGFAIFCKAAKQKKYTIVEAGEFPTWSGIACRLRKGDTVLYEHVQSFHPSFNPIGIEVQGVIQYLCETKGLKCIPRSPTYLAGPRRWAKVKSPPISSTHALDAVFHGLAFLGRNSVNNVDFTNPKSTIDS